MDTTIIPPYTDDVTGTMTTDSEETSVRPIFSVFMVVKFTIGCLGCLGNSFVCLIFLHPGTQKNQTNVLITHQAFIDLGSSILFVIYTVYDTIGLNLDFDILFLDAVLCFIVKSRILIFTSLAVSTYNLTLISLERYFATVHPVRYPKIFTRRYLRVMMATVWLLAPVPQYFILWESRSFQDGVCIVEWSLNTSGIILFLWEYFLPVSFMSFSFICIVNKLNKLNNFNSPFIKSNHPNTAVSSASDKFQASAIGPDGVCNTMTNYRGPPDTSNRSYSVPGSTMASCTSLSAAVSIEGGLNRKQKTDQTTKRRATSWRVNATKTLFIVYVVYIVCWTPNQFAFLYLTISGSLDYFLHSYQITVILAIFNSCVNPFIYALRHKTYKDKVYEMFTGWKICFCRRWDNGT